MPAALTMQLPAGFVDVGNSWHPTLRWALAFGSPQDSASVLLGEPGP